MPIPLLLADWLQAVGPLLGFVLWIVYQVIAATKQQQAEQPRAPRPEEFRADPGNDWDLDPHEQAGLEELAEEPAQARAGGQGGGAVAQAGGRNAPGDVRSEVEQFLRRLGEQQQAAGKKPKRSIDPFEEPTRRKPKRKRKQRNVESPRVDVITEDSQESPQSNRRVGERLTEGRLAEHASHLGEHVAQADDRLEARLHEKFDHRLGNISSRSSGDQTPAEAEPEQLSSAARVRAMLSSPSGVRDAIILQEVLSRPVDRW